MDTSHITRILILCLGLYSNILSAEVKITGFASFVAGKAISGDEFLADYPKTGIYDKDWSLSPDTSVGIQLTSDISDTTSITVQLTNNGASDFETRSEWAYINYQHSSRLSIQLGRKRLPLYYYSDTFDLGYAYNWIRPPADNYTWQISHYNGISFIYEPQLSSIDILFNLYFGREDSHNNELLSLFSGVPVNETWKNIAGLVSELSGDWYEIRLAHMSSQLDREINNTQSDKDAKQSFDGISINLFYGNFTFLSEFNFYERSLADIEITTHMQSLAYTYKKFTPHITRSEFEQTINSSNGDEHHFTNSIGIRWDYKPNIAFKIQYDKTTDKGITIPVLGDAELFTLGVDIVY